TQEQPRVDAMDVTQFVEFYATIPHRPGMYTGPAHSHVDIMTAPYLLSRQHAQLPLGSAAFKRRDDMKDRHGLRFCRRWRDHNHEWNKIPSGVLDMAEKASYDPLNCNRPLSSIADGSSQMSSIPSSVTGVPE